MLVSIFLQVMEEALGPPSLLVQILGRLDNAWTTPGQHLGNAWDALAQNLKAHGKTLRRRHEFVASPRHTKATCTTCLVSKKSSLNQVRNGVDVHGCVTSASSADKSPPLR